jgi:hypothetical protein
VFFEARWVDYATLSLELERARTPRVWRVHRGPYIATACHQLKERIVPGTPE